ncbi:MAG: HAD-IB family hydrolase [Planctomycetota bacterium]
MSAIRRLALFDLDGTLTPRDTEDEWATLLGERGIIDPAPHREFNAAYHRGDLDLDAYFAWYATVLRAAPLAELERLRDELVRERMLPSVPTCARQWIEAAHAESDAVLLVTASNWFLTEPFGRALGFTDTLGTRYALVDGAFTGEREGEPCFREGKLHHVRAWLADRRTDFDALEHSTFFSDSHNDLPLLRAVDRPIAVDPDPQLLREARAAGWEQQTLGDRA